MKYEIQKTSQFKKDFKLALKRNCDIKKLQEIITILAGGETLPKSCFDHPIRDDYLLAFLPSGCLLIKVSGVRIADGSPEKDYSSE